MRHYFQVKYGFGPMDFETVEEVEVEKAIYAQIKKVPIQLGSSYVNGSNIIVIRPAFYKHTGWFGNYEPATGDDMRQIKRDCPDYDGLIEAYKERVAEFIKSGQTSLIGKSGPLIMLEEKT